MNIEIKHKVCREDWDDLTKDSDQTTPFVDFDYLNNVIHNVDLLGLYVNKKLMIGLPIILDEDFKPALKPMSFNTYQGLLLRRDVDRNNILYAELMKIFIDYLLNIYKNFYISNHNSITNFTPFIWHKKFVENNSKLIYRHTAIIDFNFFETESSECGFKYTNRKRDFIKAKKNFNFEWGEISHLNHLIDFMKINFELQKQPLNSKQIYAISEISRFFYSKKLARIGVSYDKNHIIKCVYVFLMSHSKTYYLFSGIDQDARDSGVGTFTIHESIKNLKNDGIRTMDLLGANSPNRGKFKLTLGAEISPYVDLKI